MRKDEVPLTKTPSTAPVWLVDNIVVIHLEQVVEKVIFPRLVKYIQMQDTRNPEE